MVEKKHSYGIFCHIKTFKLIWLQISTISKGDIKLMYISMEIDMYALGAIYIP